MRRTSTHHNSVSIHVTGMKTDEKDFATNFKKKVKV